MISVNEQFIPIKQRFSKVYRLIEVLNLLDNPQNNLPTINIVGTNGKGSTSFYLSKGLLKKYQKVGLFISPAFLYQNERIQINNEYISDSDLTNYLEKINPYINEYELTFFEIWTLIAILYFNDQNVDVVVMEAGIGGKLDATNLMNNQIGVLLTAIGFDHTEILGKSIESILENKLGILKPNTELFISSDNLKYASIINDVLKTYNFKTKVHWTKPVIDDLSYQKANKGLVREYLKTLEINDADYLNLTPPLGRFTILKNEPLILIDGAHNENGMEHLISSFKEIYPSKKPLILAGFSDHKDYKKLLNLLENNFNNINITEFNHFKSWKIPDSLNNLKIEDWKGFISKNIASKNDIIICGSLYFIPLVYEWFKTIN